MKRAAGLALLFIICVLGFLAGEGFFPLFAVSGDAMAPAINSGSLVTIKSVAPGDIKTGDIIVYNVPARERDYFHYPPEVTRRVAEIIPGPPLAFRTRGDKTGDDPFTIGPGDVRGLAGQAIPYLGLVLLFLRNWLAMVFVLLVLGLLAILLYRHEIMRRFLGTGRREAVPASSPEKTEIPTPEAEPEVIKQKAEVKPAAEPEIISEKTEVTPAVEPEIISEKAEVIPAVEPEVVREKKQTAPPAQPPKKPAGETGKRLFPARKKAPSPGKGRKQVELPDEAMNAHREIYEALDRLKRELDKMNNQE